MSTLPTDLRNKLERACIAARNLAERAAGDALKSLAVAHHEPYGHMKPEQRTLRNKLRARARQLGDTQDSKGQLAIVHLAHECAYEHWHRMLFARFLAENCLLMLIEDGEKPVAVSLDDCKELAKEAKTNLWTLAGRYAQTMLPEVFRSDDPVLQVLLAREDQIKLEELLDGLARETFTASDALGWCYQFWQTERKDQVNASEKKIGAEELPSVTQLFTEDYMVDFLLDNTLGAWWAGKVLAANPNLAESANSEDELRKAVSLPGCPWKYLRFIKGKDGKWTPAAGTFKGWPKTAKELKCLDPCCGSGHFIVAMFERLVSLRLAEEKLSEKTAVEEVIRDNLFGLELDPRCTQIGAFSVALAAWRRMGHCALPAMHIACAGLAPNTREADWLKLAGASDKLQRGMSRLYRLFQNAPVLGSLINPRAGGGDLLEAGFQELRPLLAKALEAEKFRLREGTDDSAHEMAVTAQGITKAAEILAGQFTLVATNVPYLGRGKQDDVLMDYCERVHPEAKADLATAFVERCLEFCQDSGTAALVTPQNWLFLTSYRKFRIQLLGQAEWNCVAKLGARAFETIGGEVVNVALLKFSRRLPSPEHLMAGLDAGNEESPMEKAKVLREHDPLSVLQMAQADNPDARIVLSTIAKKALLRELAEASHGQGSFDSPRFCATFWEIPSIRDGWVAQQSTPSVLKPYGGCHFLFRWEEGRGSLARMMEAKQAEGYSSGKWRAGVAQWGKRGVLAGQMGDLPCTLYLGSAFDENASTLVPHDPRHLPALWAFCESDEFRRALKEIDQSIKITCKTLAKVPFDLNRWEKVALERYPQGLPKPFSSDSTQWLFNGNPQRADQPLQVAVARLLGYQWPRQTGSSFPDCPALGPDGLERFADDDGIVCIPSVRGERPAAERLRALLATSYGNGWESSSEAELLRASGSDLGDLEDWLRSEFFEAHCDIFHQRPFIWHIWDGRNRDGFHALVNYHCLANGDQGRRTLENLAHSYLGDWIIRQKDGMKRGEEGADERLAAAEALKEKLVAILDGEPPFDIFVRWKPLSQQAIGWQPDINDGARMNIRPFMAADIPGGKKGAGVLRIKPNIKWDKDRGKEPTSDKKDFPWFWNGSGFTGDRVNDVHLTKEQKEKSRK